MVIRDLFSEQGSGYLNDPVLLERLVPEHYEDWIAGAAAQAQKLVDVHPGNDDFDVKDA